MLVEILILLNFISCLGHATVDCNYPWTHSRKTCFQVSNIEVFPPKCEVLLLDTAQREDVSNQQEREKLSERRPTFNDLRNQVKELAQDYSFSEVVGETSSLWTVSRGKTSHLGGENFKVWHLKLRRLTSLENMFYGSAFTGKCNRRYHLINY